MYQVEGVVDFVQVYGMGDEWGQFDIVFYCVFYYVWQLVVVFYVIEGGVYLFVFGYQLEWVGGDFLFGIGYVDYYVLVLVMVCVFQCCVYYVDVVDVFEVVVYVLGGYFDDDLLDWCVEVFWVDVVGGVEFVCQFEFGWIGVYCDDVVGFGLVCILDYCQVDVIKVEYCYVVVFLYFGGVVYCVDVGGDVVVEQVDVFWVGVWIDFCQ